MNTAFTGGGTDTGNGDKRIYKRTERNRGAKDTRIPLVYDDLLYSMIDKSKLTTHIKLCKRNLRSDRVKCCAGCPFECVIIESYPELRDLFEEKRRRHGKAKEVR